MDIPSSLVAGFVQAASLTNLFYCFVGVTLGTLIGVLPGIGAMLGIALLLPVTFHLPPDAAIIMLAGLYYGGEYGGSITSILVNLPGSASSAVTCLDGHQMAKQGRAAVALYVTAVASFIAGTTGIILMTLFSPLIANFALSFTSVDYFSVMLLGLLASASVGRGSPVKSIGALIVGVLFGIIGTDVNTGMQRYTFGYPELITGLGITVIAMGLFGVPEVIAGAESKANRPVAQRVRIRDMLPTRDEVRRATMPVVRGTSLGSLLGALPGTGVTIAAFLAYSIEKKVSHTPERFGHGAIEGVAAPESANNAAAQTAFIPTLTLGIPGSATMALILGALMIHGIPPGPQFMTAHADLFWALVASFWIGNLFLLVLNIPLVGLWVRLLQVPYKYLFPTIICLICVGIYSVNLSTFDIWVVLGIGLLGYSMRMTGFDCAPLLMGFILGPLMEENLRRALMLNRGDFSVFIKSPISLTCLLLTALLLLWPLISGLRQKIRARAAAQ
ncbi:MULTISPECIES: tripartite tricarboxylate transporter permease [unclassified Aminobacter]|jgi:putative tricarboxylic transport membrane protein|uniref:tripartite tricarboxylate transporter permease n=1 Tax=unclassified Aminobacter TaxID=2644704 RepID=UPI0004657D84|nr:MULTISPECIES: tripartite tricarboxylate transporter permease [unclassified Aminobacter]TWG67666.1 TctA family transporter [Aminobacter sp. J44]TWH28249.1 TctA family transporter [Aminobacter sp. J15]